MPHQFSTLTFTEDVEKIKYEMGSRAPNAMLTQPGLQNRFLGPDEQGFIRNRDAFYIATVDTADWLYIQFRGSSIGFLHILGNQTLAYANLIGTHQYDYQRQPMRKRKYGTLPYGLLQLRAAQDSCPTNYDPLE